MNSTKGHLFFSTSRLINPCLAILLTGFMLFPGTLVACGPENDYWSSIRSSFRFDPEKKHYNDSRFIIGAYLNSLTPNVDYKKLQDDRNNEYKTKLLAAIKQTERKIKLGWRREWDESWNENADGFIKVDAPWFDIPSYSWGICAGNSVDNIEQFLLLAINDNNLTDAEVVEIISRRVVLHESCGYKYRLNNTINKRLIKVHNNYERYILAAALFYLKDFEQAERHFSILANSDDGSLKELGSYMLARIYMIESQEKWNGWWKKRELIDKALALNSVKAFIEYVRAYPNGRYVKSAKGLIRRGYWLAGDDVNYKKHREHALGDAIESILKTKEWTNDQIKWFMDIITEYYLYGDINHSENSLTLLEKVASKTIIPEQPNEKQKVMQRLVNFYHMYMQYHKGEYIQIIKVIGSYSGQISIEKILLARALEKNGNYEAAINAWSDYYSYDRSNASAEIGRIIMQQYGISQLFKNIMLHNDITLKAFYLSTVCDGNVLESMLKDKELKISDKQMIFAELASGFLVAGNFQELHELFKRSDDDLLQNFSKIRTAVRDISDGVELGRAYMNIGYFMKTSMRLPFQHLPKDLQSFRENESCRIKNESEQLSATPYYYLNHALTYFDESKTEYEQKTLHFLVLCGKGGWQYTSCHWGIQPADGLTSKMAFEKLHKKYRGSKWADKTQYYY